MTKAWRWYGAYYRGSGARLAASVLLSVTQSALALPIAYLAKYAFDRAMPSRSIPLLVTIGLAILGVHVTNTAVALVTRRLSLTTTKRAIAALRLDLVDWLHARSTAFFTHADVGRLQTTVVQDTERLDVMSNALLAQILPALTIGAGLTAWMAVLNWRLVVAAACAVPLWLTVNQIVGTKVRKEAVRFRQQFEAFNNDVLRLLRLVHLTRIQTAETAERARLTGAIDRLRVTSGRTAWLASAYLLTQNTVSTICGVTVLLIGGSAVARGTMTVGDLASFFVGVSLLAPQVSAAITAVPQVIAGNQSLLALFELAHDQDIRPYRGTRRIAFKGRIAIESVEFSYGERLVLSGVSLAIEPGVTTALVGPNGTGKTSLVSLILGLYRPNAGRLSADGHPFDDLDIDDIRRSIGVVTQDPVMIPGTIWENLTYGRDDASRASVLEAAGFATAHGFIESLPLAYETPIGEDGLLLSGGQRQRLAIARALVRAPVLLILDEPTNHLDAESVRELLANLKHLPNRPAILIITHAPDVAAEADRLFVLDDRGQLSEDHWTSLKAVSTGP